VRAVGSFAFAVLIQALVLLLLVPWIPPGWRGVTVAVAGLAVFGCSRPHWSERRGRNTVLAYAAALLAVGALAHLWLE
jgi:hypothetical protein